MELQIDATGHLIAADAFVIASDTFYVKETNTKKRKKIYKKKQYSMLTATKIQIRFYVNSNNKKKIRIAKFYVTVQNPYLSIFQNSNTHTIKISKYSKTHQY